MVNSSYDQIRDSFVSFFKKNQHQYVKSSALVPTNDPTLLFVNAGMVQFKDIFLGEQPAQFNRAITCQKCIRAGGKHNDLENVGYTTRHHTFFEMLGNFSFGDYFKEEAIFFAWEFLTKELGLDKNKLYITIYHTDDEAYKIWNKLTGFSDDRIARISTKDNFWSMGAVGPCGPCTEIFYDFGEDLKGNRPGTGDEGDRFIEIWNLVFMQYNMQNDGSLISLKHNAVDTGMGLERLVAILQGVRDNYETDLFQKLINEIKKITASDLNNLDPTYKILADHIRSVAFLMAEGVMPSNIGRGYVLRRIIRRAVRYTHLLGATTPVFHEILPILVDLMGEHYPELKENKDFIYNNILNEEKNFLHTLEKGINLLENEVSNLGQKNKLQGEFIFKLYDTYGFPIDLTKDVAREKNIQLDIEGFEKCMEAQKLQAKQNWSGSGDKKLAEIWNKLQHDLEITSFVGYNQSENISPILGLLSTDGKKQNFLNIHSGETIILTKETCFYAESGGQAGDKGEIILQDDLNHNYNKHNISNQSEQSNQPKLSEQSEQPEATIFRVKDTQKLGDLYLHIGSVISGKFTNNALVKLQIDIKRRKQLVARHSATHLLHKALRNILGSHVMQKGSLIEENSLRFDFSHNEPLQKQEIKAIEEKVNFYIRQNLEVTTQITNKDKAIKMGAMAIFGEKYQEEVRVVSMGYDNDLKDNYSIELCGGTHVKYTGDIGIFLIKNEGSVASGIRRIEALVAEQALDFLNSQREVLARIINQFKTSANEIEIVLSNIVSEKKKIEEQCSNLNKKLLYIDKSDENNKLLEIGDIKIQIKITHNISIKEIKPALFDLFNKLSPSILIMCNIIADKVIILVKTAENITNKVGAKDILDYMNNILAGKGGGNKNFAQGQGKNVEKLTEVINGLDDFIKEVMNRK